MGRGRSSPPGEPRLRRARGRQDPTAAGLLGSAGAPGARRTDTSPAGPLQRDRTRGCPPARDTAEARGAPERSSRGAPGTQPCPGGASNCGTGRSPGLERGAGSGHSGAGTPPPAALPSRWSSVLGAPCPPGAHPPGPLRRLLCPPSPGASREQAAGVGSGTRGRGSPTWQSPPYAGLLARGRGAGEGADPAALCLGFPVACLPGEAGGGGRTGLFPSDSNGIIFILRSCCLSPPGPTAEAGAGAGPGPSSGGGDPGVDDPGMALLCGWREGAGAPTRGPRAGSVGSGEVVREQGLGAEFVGQGSQCSHLGNGRTGDVLLGGGRGCDPPPGQGGLGIWVSGKGKNPGPRGFSPGRGCKLLAGLSCPPAPVGRSCALVAEGCRG